MFSALLQCLFYLYKFTMSYLTILLFVLFCRCCLHRLLISCCHLIGKGFAPFVVCSARLERRRPGGIFRAVRTLG
ncbi:hypothetical protein F5051DRAFT_416721 [Lentinula edodes]|nr:hypothetical protein F5051DRAFT_416721 [Lentinula edodes]